MPFFLPSAQPNPLLRSLFNKAALEKSNLDGRLENYLASFQKIETFTR